MGQAKNRQIEREHCDYCGCEVENDYVVLKVKTPAESLVKVHKSCLDGRDFDRHEPDNFHAYEDF